MFTANLQIITVYILTLLKLFLLIFGYGIYAGTVYIRDIIYISMFVRPEWKVFGRYLKFVFFIPDLKPVKVFVIDANIGNKEDSCGIIKFPKDFECRIIRSERIKKLQSVILKKLYASWFEISCSNDDLKVLSSFGSSGWLTHNLLLASGIKKKKAVVLGRESMRKIQTVFRAYVSSLALYLKLENEIRVGTVELSKPGILTRIGHTFGRKRPERLVTKNIYPRAIEIQSLKIKRENIVSYGMESARQIKIDFEYTGFNKYLSAQSLIMEGRIQDRDKIEKLMNKLELLH